jgi:hypothetical protein
MPRYIPIDTVSFTDKNGNTYPVKVRRPIENQAIRLTLNILSGEDIDEVVSRAGIFGELSEYRSYQVVDANIVKLKEARFDTSKIRKLRVPN